MSEAELGDQAVDWLVLLRSGAVTDEQRREFDAWLSSSASHRKAFEDAENLLGEVAEVLKAKSRITPALSSRLARRGGKGWTTSSPKGMGPAVVRSPHPRLVRRQGRERTEKPVARSLALAACLLATIWISWPHLNIWLFSDFSTGVGEQWEVVLEDGSRVLLNTDTAIKVSWKETARHVDLLRGQARFQVASDPLRSFEVQAGSLTVRALGTVFDVYRHGNAVDVSVIEHAVKAKLEGRVSGEIRISESQRLKYGGRGALGEPTTVSLSELTAWQRHKLIFKDQALREVVEEINRYSRSHLFIADDRLKSLRMSGVFTADSLGEVIAAIEKAFSIQATQIGPWLVILHS